MPAALRKMRTKVARETCDSAASSSRVQSSAGALNMAVTARAEDGEARSFIRSLDDAACSKCTRSIMTKSAVARSVATAVAPGRAASSSSSIVCTSIRMRSSSFSGPRLSTIVFGRAATTKLSGTA